MPLGAEKPRHTASRVGDKAGWESLKRAGVQPLPFNKPRPSGARARHSRAWLAAVLKCTLSSKPTISRDYGKCFCFQHTPVCNRLLQAPKTRSISDLREPHSNGNDGALRMMPTIRCGEAHRRSTMGRFLVVCCVRVNAPAAHEKTWPALFNKSWGGFLGRATGKA